jgi:hypothetical protein
MVIDMRNDLFTIPQACGRQSVRPSHFYELDLALAGGNKTIADCLKDFTKVKMMLIMMIMVTLITLMLIIMIILSRLSG